MKANTLRRPFTHSLCAVGLFRRSLTSPLSFATFQRPTVCFLGNVRVFPKRALPCGFLLTVRKGIVIMVVNLAWSPVLGGLRSAPQRMEARRSECKGFRFVLPRLASPRLASPRLAWHCLVIVCLTGRGGADARELHSRGVWPSGSERFPETSCVNGQGKECASEDA